MLKWIKAHPTQFPGIFLILCLIVLFSLVYWGAPKAKCIISLFVNYQAAEALCSQVYPDTWRKNKE